MTIRSLALAQAVRRGCATFREEDNALWLGTEDGAIVTARLLDARVRVRCTGFTDLVAVLPAGDGLGLFAIEAGGAVLHLSRLAVSRSHSRLVTDLKRVVAAAHLTTDGASALILESGPAASLIEVDLSIGTETPIAGPFADPIAMAVDAGAGTATVLQGPAGAREIVAVDLALGTLGAPVAVPNVDLLMTAPAVAGAGHIVSTLAGALRFMDALGTAGPDTVTLVAPIRALARWGSLVLAVMDTNIAAVEWALGEGAVPVDVPLGPIIVNGYVTVSINPAGGGVTWEQVRVEVEEGPLAGLVSAAIEGPAPPGARWVRVVAGPTPGERHLAVIRISDGVRVGRARLRVTRLWPDEDKGPQVTVTGRYRTLAHWGGGPKGPRNIGNHAAPDVWRVAIVFVGTRDLKFQENLATADPRWHTRLFGPGGTAQTFYEEVSFRNTPAGGSTLKGTTIVRANNGINAPVFIDAGWGDLFETWEGGATNTNLFGGWKLPVESRAAIAGAFCDMLIDAGTAATLLPQIDAVVFVIQNASENAVKVGDELMRAKFCWPQAWQGVNFHWKGELWTTIDPKPAIFMPHAPPTGMPPDPTGAPPISIANVLCHELGHTLGCADLYNAGDFPEPIDVRLMGPLDLMDNAWRLPHFSLANRMRLGWIDPAWIESIDFGATPTSRIVTLQAIETLARSGPPAGRRAGVEVRIRPGRNYYFEYRRSQAGQVGDNGLVNYFPTSRMIVGSDVVEDGVDPIARPDILRLPLDADGDGPVLDAPNEDYAETDVTDPERQHDFRVILEQIDPVDANAARVRLDYVRAHRADLQIRPAPGRRPPLPPDWKSPDIDLEGPAGKNVVATGHKHTIVVRVRNGGTVDAEDVRIRVFSQPFTATKAGGALEVQPTAARQTIPKQQTREFRLDWSVPKETLIDKVVVEHFCIRVEVDRYVDPRDPSRNEIVVHNNSAQSNFDSTAVAHASPSERRTTGVTVANALPRRATYELAIDQESPFFRAYVGHSWVRLGPGETRMLDLAYESLAGDPVFGKAFDDDFLNDRPAPPNKLALTSLLDPPEGQTEPTGRIIFGANLTIAAGRRTMIRELRLTGEAIRGLVESDGATDGRRVSAGAVNAVLWRRRRPDEPFLVSGTVDAQGFFTLIVPGDVLARLAGDAVMGEALYLGAHPWAPCRSKTRHLA